MEDKELEKLSAELRDVPVPEELDLESILKEDFDTGPEGAVPPEAPESAPDGEQAPFELPPELSDQAAAEEFPEEPPESPEEPERRTVPEIPLQALMLLAGMALAAVLASLAVALKLSGTPWRVLMTLSLAVACVPMAIGSLSSLKDRGRVPAELVMIAACLIRALSGGVVEAVIAAILFNLLYAVMEAFTRHELHLVYGRLEEGLTELEGPQRERVEAQLREIASRRLKPILSERALDRLVLLGLLVLGVVISVLPPLLSKTGFSPWIGRAAALLAVALYAGEAGELMNALNAVEVCVSNGLYFSGTGTMAASAEITSVLMSKSGTLTDGEYRVTGVDPVRLSEDQLVFLAAYAGAWSDHPLHRALRLYAGSMPDRRRVERHQERPGYGTVVQLDGDQLIAAGNIDLMEELGVKGDMYIPGGTCMFVAVGRTLVGRIDFADAIRPEAPGAVGELRRQHVANVALMTGDNASNATNVGRALGITEIYSDCRPADKLSRLQYILDSQEKDDRLMFVSAGRADRELLEMANIGVAMGEYKDATGTFPDLVIPSGSLTKLPQAIAVARALRRNSRLSFLVSSAVRLLTAVLAVAGVLSLWSAATVTLLLEAGLFFNTHIPEDH